MNEPLQLTLMRALMFLQETNFQQVLKSSLHAEMSIQSQHTKLVSRVFVHMSAILIAFSNMLCKVNIRRRSTVNKNNRSDCPVVGHITIPAATLVIFEEGKCCF